jgi:hypothetical protein
MTPKVTMRRALSDPVLLGKVMQVDSWASWKVLLIAAAGEELTAEERIIFTRLTGREREPGQMVKEFIGILGRRGGKSFAMAVFLCWIAALCDHRGVLAPGEIGVALLISRDQRVAKIILNYIEGILSQSEQMRQLIVNRTQETIELSNSVSIEVRPANYRTLRGPTFVCIACDEIAHFFTSVDYSNPDIEILAAVRPGLMTTRGPLLMVSSAYAKHGVLYDSYKRYFGPSGPPDILVAYGSSRDVNPSLSQAEIERELEKDPVRNRAEYLSEWRGDVEGFIPREIVEACVRDYFELPPAPGIAYRCFVDAASGVREGDSYAIAIAHKVGDRVVIDAIREVRPPFSAYEVINTVLVPLCKGYGIHAVRGDAYAGELAREPIRRAGISYELAKKHASELYLDPFLGMLNANKIDLPRNDRAINQICSLERSIQRSGHNQISHPSHGHDDISNAIAGAVDFAANFTLFDSTYSWVSGRAPAETIEQAKEREAAANARWRQQQLAAYMLRASQMPNPRGW